MPQIESPENWKLPKVIEDAFRSEIRGAPELWLGGGGALRVILGKENSGVWAGDWDLYCTPAAFERLTQQSGLSFEEEEHEWRAFYDRYLNHEEHLQVSVGQQFKLPTMIFRYYDLSIVRLAISVGGIIFEPQALSDILAGRMRILVPHLQTEERVKKYTLRGFTPIGS